MKVEMTESQQFRKNLKNQKCKISYLNERYRLWREKILRDQGSPLIILCTPVKF